MQTQSVKREIGATTQMYHEQNSTLHHGAAWMLRTAKFHLVPLINPMLFTYNAYFTIISVGAYHFFPYPFA